MPACAGALREQRAGQRVGLDVDHDHVLALRAAGEHVADPGGGMAGGVDDDRDLRRRDQRQRVVGDVRRPARGGRGEGARRVALCRPAGARERRFRRARARGRRCRRRGCPACASPARGTSRRTCRRRSARRRGGALRRRAAAASGGGSWRGLRQGGRGRQVGCGRGRRRAFRARGQVRPAHRAHPRRRPRAAPGCRGGRRLPR